MVLLALRGHFISLWNALQFPETLGQFLPFIRCRAVFHHGIHTLDFLVEQLYCAVFLAFCDHCFRLRDLIHFHESHGLLFPLLGSRAVFRHGIHALDCTVEQLFCAVFLALCGHCFRIRDLIHFPESPGLLLPLLRCRAVFRHGIHALDLLLERLPGRLYLLPEVFNILSAFLPSQLGILEIPKSGKTFHYSLDYFNSLLAFGDAKLNTVAQHILEIPHAFLPLDKFLVGSAVALLLDKRLQASLQGVVRKLHRQLEILKCLQILLKCAELLLVLQMVLREQLEQIGT